MLSTDLDVGTDGVALWHAVVVAVQFDLPCVLPERVLHDEAAFGHELDELVLSRVLGQTADVHLGVLTVIQLEPLCSDTGVHNQNQF